MLALGMLVAVGAAFGDRDGWDGQNDGQNEWDGQHGDHDGWDGHDGDHDSFDGRGGGKYIDWLNPGGYYYSTWYYPTYNYYWYPEYAYTYPTYPTYPTYYYTAPVVTPPVTTPTYTTYYPDPLVYDPWYGANVYGWGGVTYYYTSSWSWSGHGGFFI